MTDAIITLENGALFDKEGGRIVAGAPMDSAQASALARIRWDKRRQAVARGMALASDRFQHEYDAIEAIATHQTVLATTRMGRESTEAAKFLLRAGDFLEPPVQTLDNDSVQSLAIADSLLAVRDIIHDLTK